ncbi:putative Ig domain-containing protein [bacterium]|jgi:hypothetical protein|nr:putative Ig domain-containing protein [bacterium]
MNLNKFSQFLMSLLGLLDPRETTSHSIPILRALGLLISSFAFEPLKAETVSGIILPAYSSDSNQPAGALLNLLISSTDSTTIGQRTQTITDAEGRFQIELSPGTWRVSPSPREATARSLAFSSGQIEIKPGQDTSDFVLVGLEGNTRITGAVTTAEGTPLPSVFIFASHWINKELYSISDTTDVKGNFEFNVVPGEWQVSTSVFIEGLLPIPPQTINVTKDIAINFTAQIASPTLNITSANLPEATAGLPYETSISVANEDGLFQWTLAPLSASLPAGLTLNSDRGILNGTPTVSGLFTFNIEVKEKFGSRSGMQQMTLFIATDTILPTISSAKPTFNERSSLFNLGPQFARDDSSLAIQFSEPMRPFKDTEIPSIQWTSEEGNLSSTFDPSTLIVEWNENRDTAFLVSPTPFPLGSYTWSLNSTEDINLGEPKALFRDTAGNPLAATISRRFVITHRQSDSIEPGSSLQRSPAVDSLWLVKDKVFIDRGLGPALNLTYIHTTISLPELAWNTVRHATLETPLGTSHVIPPDSRSQSNALHFNDFLTSFSTLPNDYPDGIYKLGLDTFHDGIQSLSLDLTGRTHPSRAEIIRDCESLRIPANRPFSLGINRNPMEEIDLIELVIAEDFPPALHRSPFVFGLVFQTMIDADQSHLIIPANTLQPNQDYSAVIRQYRITDENHSYPGVPVRAAFVSTTEVKLSTKDASLACLSLDSGTLFTSQSLTTTRPSTRVTVGEHLPPRSAIGTGQNDSGTIHFGSGSTLELHAQTNGVLDSSGSGSSNIILTLNSGGATIKIDPQDAQVFGFLVETETARITSYGGHSIVLHEDNSKVTSVAVLEGNVMVSRLPDGQHTFIVTAGDGVQLAPVSDTTEPTVPPQLDISHLDDGTILISWEKKFSDWQVFSRSSLDRTSAWFREEAPTSQSSNRFEMNLSASEQMQYFQLFQVIEPTP